MAPSRPRRTDRGRKRLAVRLSTDVEGYLSSIKDNRKSCRTSLNFTAALPITASMATPIPAAEPRQSVQPAAVFVVFLGVAVTPWLWIVASTLTGISP